MVVTWCHQNSKKGTNGTTKLLFQYFLHTNEINLKIILMAIYCSRSQIWSISWQHYVPIIFEIVTKLVFSSYFSCFTYGTNVKVSSQQSRSKIRNTGFMTCFIPGWPCRCPSDGHQHGGSIISNFRKILFAITLFSKLFLFTWSLTSLLFMHAFFPCDTLFFF